MSGLFHALRPADICVWLLLVLVVCTEGSEVAVLKADNHVIDYTSPNCTMNLPKCYRSTTFCCWDTRNRPCAVRVAGYGTTKNGRPCLDLRHPPIPAGLYNFSHSVGGTISNIAGSCRVDLEPGTTSLTVNGNEVDLEALQCWFHLTQCRNTITYCCNYRHVNCKAMMLLDKWAHWSTTCANRTVPFTYAGIYVFTHYVCGARSDTEHLCEGVSGFRSTNLSLTLDGQEIKYLSPKGCRIKLTKERQELRYCCQHESSRCQAKIVYAGVQVSRNPCVTVNLTLGTESSMYLMSILCGVESGDAIFCSVKDAPCEAGQNLTVTMSTEPLNPDGRIARVKCIWSNECPQYAWTFSFFSESGYFYEYSPEKKDFKHPHGVLTYTEMNRTSGEVVLTLAKLNCEDSELYTCTARYANSEDLTNATVRLPLSGIVLSVKVSATPGIVGQAANITCTWKNLCPAFTWEWLFWANTGLVADSSGHGLHPDSDAQHQRVGLSFRNHSKFSGDIVMTIDSVRCGDAVDYTCMAWYTDAKYRNNSCPSVTTVMQLRVSPSNPAIVRSSPDQDSMRQGLLEDTSVTVTCSAVLGFPGIGRMKWGMYDQDKTIITELLGTVQQHTAAPIKGDAVCSERSQSTLVLEVTREHMQKKLVCFVVNEEFGLTGPEVCLGYGSRACVMTDALTIMYGVRQDKIGMSRHPLILYGGEALTLSCTAEGYPYPTFNWILEQDKDVNFTKLTDRGSTYLTVSQVNSSKTGKYTCSATNVVLGRTYTATAEINILIHAEELRDNEKSRLSQMAMDRKNRQLSFYLSAACVVLSMLVLGGIIYWIREKKCKDTTEN